MIVKMSRLSIVGLMDERSAIVKRLMKLGAVELSEVSMSDEEKEEALKNSSYDDASKRIADIDEELRKIQKAITFLTHNAPIFSAKERKTHKTVDLSYDNFVDPKTYKGVWEKVFEANDLQKRLLEKRNELNNLKNERDFLTVWDKLQTPVELAGTATTALLVGTIPISADIDALLKAIDEIGFTVVEVLNSDKDQSYLTLITHSSAYDKVMEVLKASGFSKASFGETKGTISENLIINDKQIQKVESDIEKIIAVTVKKYGNLQEIQKLYDYIYNMQERRRVRSKFLKTDKAFLVGGWTPTEIAEIVKKEIEDNFIACIEITQPDENEEAPVLLKNNNAVYPFEMITEMYSLPKSKGIDPNAVMAPFYWLFFGLMLSDAGYGIILAVVSGLAIWKFKTEKGTLMDKMLKMLCFCGISTIIWGAAFGTWFGDVSSLVFGREIAPLWFNPNNDPMRLMVWSFIFGAIHIFAGMALNAYLLIREGKWLDAIYDIGLWYVVLIGIAMLFAGGALAAIGKNMAIAGAIGLVLTQGRGEKNILKKLTSGILSLYNITGFLSDVLSYSRLLALGLATGVIGQVVNQLGILPGGFKSVPTTILLIIIFIGGHIFNMAINTLGAYVHSSRLQYVEFFGKFYEGGGAAFAPLKPKLKYLKINN